jgi:hypothetical protein
MNRSKRGHASGYNSGRSFLEFDSFAMPRDPHPEQRPLRELYCRLMEELKRRRNIIADVLDSKFNLPQGIAVELCYLQLRMICELIALGCLAAHGDIPATRSGKMQKEYRPGAILTELEQLHSEFYPVPGKQIISPTTGRPVKVETVTEPYLTKTDLLALWAECGTILHRGSMRKCGQAVRRRFQQNHRMGLEGFKTSWPPSNPAS